MAEQTNKKTNENTKREIHITRKVTKNYNLTQIIINVNMYRQNEKIINLLGNIINQPSIFRTKKWVEVNNDECGRYNTKSQIKFKITMLKSSLCDYSGAYLLVKGTIASSKAGVGAAARQEDEIK